MGDRALLGGGRDDAAGLAHRKCRTATDGGQRIGLDVESGDQRSTALRIELDGPQVARLGVDRCEGPPSGLLVTLGGDGDLAGGVQLGRERVDDLGRVGLAVDREDRSSILDDVEGSFRTAVAEDDRVELVDRLVDPAVDPAVCVDDPDPAVVQLGLVGLVTIRRHGIGEHDPGGDHEGCVGRDSNLVPPDEPGASHEHPPTHDAPTPDTSHVGAYVGVRF